MDDHDPDSAPPRAPAPASAPSPEGWTAVGGSDGGGLPVDPAPAPPSSPPRPPRRRRWLLWTPVAFLVLLAIFVSFIAPAIKLNEYIISPGQAQAVAPLITVPKNKAHPVKGRLLLTDVYLTQANVLNWLKAQFNSDDAIYPASAITGTVTPVTQVLEQGYITMSIAQSTAKAAALTRLGYHLAMTNDGVLLTTVAAGSPATGKLKVGETVKGVDGVETPTPCSLAQSLAQYAVGRTVHLDVEKTTVTSDAVLKPGATTTVTIRLGKWPAALPAPTTTPSTCPGVAVKGRGYLGVQLKPNIVYDYPFPVSISTKTIGGPSAGLAMTLGIIDTLGGGHLTGGKVIAVTGTITETGAVGPVGGVPQKTVAVEQAGATAFIVPDTNLKTAESKATPTLHVYGVKNLTQALADLKKLGGTVPAAGQSSS